MEGNTTQIDSLELKIESSGAGASRSLSRLASNLDKLAQKSESFGKVISRLERLAVTLNELNSVKLPNVNSMANGLKKLNEIDVAPLDGKLKDLTATLKDFYATVSDDEGMKSFVSDLAAISRNATSAAKAVSQAQGAIPTPNAPPVSTPDSIDSGSDARGNIDGIGSALKFSTQKLREFWDTARQAGGEASAIFGKLKEAVAPIGRRIASVANGFKQIVKSLAPAKKHSDAFGGSLLRSFSRLLKYRILNGIIRAVVANVGNGINNLVHANAQFKASMDSLATSNQYLSNSIAAALAPAINALAPLIEFVVDKFVDFINVVNQLAAALTGASTWQKAVRVPAEWGDAAKNAADSTKKATNAAEEYKNALMGFDEIEKLPDPTGGRNGSGSPGSSGAAGADYSSMFTTENVDLGAHPWAQAIKDLIDTIKEQAANGDWAGVGKTLADGWGRAIDYLDGVVTSPETEAKIFRAVDAFTGLLNGYFAELTFTDGTKASIAERSGKLIGDALNLALKSADRFLTGVEWGNIGLAIAQGVNGSVKALSASDINFGKVLSSLLNAGIHGLGGFAGNVEWKAIGSFIASNINKFFDNVDWKGAGEAANNLIGGLADMLTGAIEDIDTKKITDAISDFLAGIDPIDLTIKIGRLLLSIGGKLFEAGANLMESLGLGTAFGDTAVDVQLNATANMTGVKDSLTDSQKSFKTKSIFDTAKDGLSSTEKTFGATAKFAERSDKLTAAQKTISGMTAGFTGKNTTNLNKNISGMTAVITSKSNSLSTNQKKLTGFTAVISAVKAASKKIAEWFGIKMAAGGGIYKNGRWHNPTQYAAGTPALGAPNTGELFWARESGPELVGRIGTSTAVLNNAQIVDSVSDGVYRAVKAANSGDNQSKTPIVVQLVLDGKVVGQTAVDYINGKARTTGINPLSAYI